MTRKYAELRYQLIPYTYTLAREAFDTGMPFIRALWLHYPDDETARGIGSEYLWGRDLLVAIAARHGEIRRLARLRVGRAAHGRGGRSAAPYCRTPSASSPSLTSTFPKIEFVG